MRSKLGLLTAMMMLSMTSNNFSGESEDERKKRLDNLQDLKNKERGLNKFYYGENFVWALNKKNADRKAKNKNWI